MPSPRRLLSVDELTQRASTGSAIRRGELKISDPIPSSYVHNGAEMDKPFEQRTPQLEGTWLSNDSTDGALSGRNDSVNHSVHVSRFTERASLGPSSDMSNMSSVPGMDSVNQRRSTGLRATIKRMFSSKRDRNMPLGSRHASQNTGRILSMAGPQSEQHPLSTHQDTLFSNRALHSHAPSPHLRVESADLPARKEPLAGFLGPRRNTVPDLMLIPTEEVAEQQEKSTITPILSQRPMTAVKQPLSSPVKPNNRRSRSADDFADMGNLPHHSVNQRDREEEIAYWRKSIIVDPLPSLPAPRRPDSGKDEAMVNESSSRPSIEPIQDFDFGLQITPSPSQPSTLLERVNTLEVKLYDFEYALSKLQRTEAALPRTANLHDSRSSGSTSHAAVTASRNNSAESRQHRQASGDRNSRATTVRAPRTSSDRSRTFSPNETIAIDRYDDLYDQIQKERHARQQLEAQLINISKQLDILKAPVYSYTRPSEYPTPSPDSCHNSTTLDTKRGRHRYPVRDMHETSRFSMTETDSDLEIDDVRGEIYKTPQENIFRFDSRSNPYSPMV